MPDHRSIGRAAVLGVAALAATLAGCGGVSVKAESKLPRPLVEELPLQAGVYYSAEFRNYAAHEKRWSTQWDVALGAGHVVAFDRLTKAMFVSVTPVADLAKLPPVPLDLVLEPRFEEYSFLTPRDSGGELFAVTIKYRINIYDGEARLVDSLVVTGFGNELAGSLSSGAPLAAATRKAMRDAGAKLAAEFADQPVVKKLLRHETLEPIAQGTSAATGAIGEVQPTAAKPAPPPPAPAATAPAPAPAPAATAGAPGESPPAVAAEARDAPAAAPPGPAPPPDAALPPPAPAAAPPAPAPGAASPSPVPPEDPAAPR